MPAATRTREAAALLAALALGDAIRDGGPIPAGHLYAHVMGKMNHRAFEAVLDALVGAGLVTRDSAHMLTWVGPTTYCAIPGCTRYADVLRGSKGSLCWEHAEKSQ